MSVELFLVAFLMIAGTLGFITVMTALFVTLMKRGHPVLAAILAILSLAAIGATVVTVETEARETKRAD